MKLPEFIQSIKDGKVHFNWNGHNFDYDHSLGYNGKSSRQNEIDDFVERLESRIKVVFDSEKNPPQESEHISLNMADHYKQEAKRIREYDLVFPLEYFWPVGGMEDQ